MSNQPTNFIEDPPALRTNKKYQKFHSELQKCLNSIEKTPLSDWASLNNGLGSLQRVLDSSTFKEFRDVPDRLQLCRALGKCLDPQIAMGVHRKAVETLHKICCKLGPENLGRNLPLFSISIFQLLPHAAMQTRPDILGLIEEHFVPLPVATLSVCLPGLLAAIIPSLEESETSEVHQRVKKIVTTIHTKLCEADDERLMFSILWGAIRDTLHLRIASMTYLRLALRKSKAIDQDASGGFTCPSELSDASTGGGEASVVRQALCNALVDGKQEKAQRLALDTLVFHFPLHEEGIFSDGDKTTLVRTALVLLVTNPMNATLRRVFMWLYGGNEINVAYYQNVSARYILQSLTEMFDEVAMPPERTSGYFSSSTAEAQLVFDAFVALLSRPPGEEHFQELLSDVVPVLCRALVAATKKTSLVDSTASGNIAGGAVSAADNTHWGKLFEVVPWRWFLGHVRDQLSELESIVASEAIELGQASAQVLGLVLSIVETTRPHFIALPTSAEDLDLIIGNSCRLCAIIASVSELRRARKVEGNLFSSIVKQSLGVLHILYFGIARGVLSSASTDDARRCAVTTELFDALTGAYCAVVDCHLSSKDNADVIFSSAPAAAVNREDVVLYTDMADTMFGVFSHLSQERRNPNASANCEDDQGEEESDCNCDEMPLWLEKTIQVATEAPSPLAAAASQLALDIVVGKVLRLDELRRRHALRKVVQRLWQMLAVHDSELHIHVAQLLMRAAQDSAGAPLLDEVMETAHTTNCRNFATLFRVVAELGTAEHPFTCGLFMLLGTLRSPDASLRLMARAFLEQSTPYIHRVIEPLMSQLLPSLNPTRPPLAKMLHFVTTLRSIMAVCPQSFVRRTISLQPLTRTQTLLECFAASSVPSDNEMPVPNMLCLICLLTLRILRLEHHNCVSVLISQQATASSDIAMLRSLTTPPIQQGDESTLCIDSLELLKELVTVAVGFSEPPESVVQMCQHVSIAVVDLLHIAVVGRLPSAQVGLLEVLLVTVTFLDGLSYRRSNKHRSHSNDQDTGGALPGAVSATDTMESNSSTAGLLSSLTSRRRHDKGGGTHQVSTVPAIAMGEFFRTFTSGIVASGVAELHPTMCAYGLLAYWKDMSAAILPKCHGLLHSATYELCSVFVNVIRTVNQRPLSAASSIILRRCFQGLTDIVQFLFLPSTRAHEGVPVQPAASASSGPGNWFSDGGKHGGEQPTNYELALKELMSALEDLVSVSLDTFVAQRVACATEQPTRDAASSHLRLSVETSIRLLMEVMIKDFELDFFDRLLWMWMRRNPDVLSTADSLTSEGQENVLTVELLLTSAGITPPALISVIDNLLSRFRRGSVKAAAAKGGEMTYDATAFHFLCLYMSRAKAPERLGSSIGQLLDVVTAHVNAHSGTACFPVVIHLLDLVHRRHAAAGGTVDVSRDKRTTGLICKVLDGLATSNIGEQDDSAPIVHTVRLLASVLPTFGAAVFPKDSDKMLEAVQAFFSKACVPSLRGAMDSRDQGRVLACANRTVSLLSLLQGLLRFGDPVVKRLRGDIFDIIFAQNFFKMPRIAVHKWKGVLELVTGDRSLGVQMLQKFTGTNATSVFTAIVQSQDDEAFSRGRLLKRLAFFLFCAKTLDRELITGVRDRVADTLRTFSAKGAKQVPIRYALFVFRVLMTRVQPSMLYIFWPSVLPELIRILSHYGSSQEPDLYLEALKIIDFSVAVLPSEFQVFRWVFLDDQGIIKPHGGGGGAPSGGGGVRVAFTPLVRSLHDEVPATIDLRQVRKEAPAKQRGYGRQPLLSIPERCYFDISSIEALCGALSAASAAVDDGIVEEDNSTNIMEFDSPPSFAGPSSTSSQGLSSTQRTQQSPGSSVMSNRAAQSPVNQASPTIMALHSPGVCSGVSATAPFHHNVVLRTDVCDFQYIDWLLEAEFLHVGIAHSEQMLLAYNQQSNSQQQQQQQQQVGQTGGMSPQMPTGMTPPNGAGTKVSSANRRQETVDEFDIM